jgi:heme A synthase
LRSFLDIRYLAALSALATYGLIVLGGTVRATESGLACPDWPLCHGQVIPPLERQILIEYSHRLAASAVGLLIVLTAVSGWLWYRESRIVRFGTVAAIAILIVQVLLGGVTVNMELPDTIVALHLSVALSLLAVLVALAVGTYWEGSGRPLRAATAPGREDNRLPWLIAGCMAAVFLLIVLGSYVANSEAALVYPDWPLFDGKLVSSGGKLADLHYAHRLMAAGVGLLLGALALWIWRRERRPALVAAAALALVVYVAEVFVGASNIWFELATSVRVLHLALASALWLTLTFALAWTYAERRWAETA